jgi:hypothetical protein
VELRSGPARGRAVFCVPLLGCTYCVNVGCCSESKKWALTRESERSLATPFEDRLPRLSGAFLCMARSRFNDPIEPMDLANMRQNGVRSLAVECHQCRHEVIMNVDHLPGHVTVPSFGPKMVCTKCGTIGADARPNWREVTR